jgi:hypothetical protein
VFFSLRKSREKIRKFSKKHKRFFVISVLLFAFLLFRAVFSANPISALYFIVRIVQAVVMCLYTANFVKEKIALKKALLTLSATVIFQVVLSVLQVVNQGSLQGVFYWFGERYFTADTPGIANAIINNTLVLRPYGTFPHPNVLAGFLLLMQVVFVSSCSVVKNKNHQTLIIIAIVACFVGIMASLSRVAILLETICILVYASIFTVRKVKKNLTRIAFLFIAAFLCSILLFQPRIYQTSLNENSIQERAVLIQQSVQMISEQPLIGVGVNNFLNELAGRKDKDTPLQPVHNALILIAVETGIVVAAGVVVLFIQLIKKSTRLKKKMGMRYVDAVLLLLIILSISMTDHYFVTIQQGRLMLAVVLGLLIASFEKNKGVMR